MLIYAATTQKTLPNLPTANHSKDETTRIQSSVHEDTDDQSSEIHSTPTFPIDETDTSREDVEITVSSFLNSDVDSDFQKPIPSSQQHQEASSVPKCLTDSYSSSSIKTSQVETPPKDSDDHRQWNNPVPTDSKNVHVYHILNAEMESSNSSANNSVQSNKAFQNIASGQNVVLIPLLVGTACIVTIGIILVILYSVYQKGRRGKVYLSHLGAPPKDFAEDTGVRSPVLLPDEIQMQAAGLVSSSGSSLRVRRAVVLATDPPIDERPEVESESTVGTEESVLESSLGECTASTTPPPPPPYRTPPPYPPIDSLPDMVIRNFHAK